MPAFLDGGIKWYISYFNYLGQRLNYIILSFLHTSHDHLTNQMKLACSDEEFGFSNKYRIYLFPKKLIFSCSELVLTLMSEAEDSKTLSIRVLFTPFFFMIILLINLTSSSYIWVIFVDLMSYQYCDFIHCFIGRCYQAKI